MILRNESEEVALEEELMQKKRNKIRNGEKYIAVLLIVVAQ